MENNIKEKYVFISYSHRDTKIILPIIQKMSLVANVWYDDGIHAGSEWEDTIAKKIMGCEGFLYFVSKNSIESKNCKNEIHLANKKDKKFVCIFIEDIVALPPFLELIGSRIQSIFYYKNPNPDALVDKVFVDELQCLRKSEIEIEIENNRRIREQKEKKKRKAKKIAKTVGISLGVVVCSLGALFGSRALLENREEKTINYIENRDYKSALKLCKTFRWYGETRKLISLCNAGQAFENNDYVTGLTHIQNINGTYDFEVNFYDGQDVKDDSVKFLGISAQKEDYKFLGWNIDDYSIDVKKYNVYLKLSAKYEEIRYEITYNLDGGTLPSNAQTYYTSQQGLTLPVPTKVGYKFDGWTKGTDTSYIDKIEKGSKGDINLTAHWSLGYYTLTVVSNNASYGTATGGGSFPYNAQCTITATPSNAACKFNGWYYKGSLVSTKATYTLNMPSEDAEYVANFSFDNSYKPNVTYTDYSRTTSKTITASTDIMNPATPYIDTINFKTLGGYSCGDLRLYGYTKLTLSLSLQCSKSKYGFLSYNFAYDQSSSKIVNTSLTFADSSFINSYSSITTTASCTITVMLSDVTSSDSFYLIWNTFASPSNGGTSTTSNVKVKIAIS